MNQYLIISGSICIVFSWALSMFSRNDNKHYYYYICVSITLLLVGLIMFIFGTETVFKD